MTDEEINRKFDIVADHLAALAVGLQTLTAQVDKLSEKADRNADSVAALLTITQIQSQEIKDLGESVRRVDARQRETDERLNILVNTVERYISERRNGAENGNNGG